MPHLIILAREGLDQDPSGRGRIWPNRSQSKLHIGLKTWIIDLESFYKALNRAFCIRAYFLQNAHG